MTRVLWISNDEMRPKPYVALKHRLGKFELRTVSKSRIEDLKEDIQTFDIIALDSNHPLQLSDVIKASNGKIVLTTEYRNGQQFFQKWRQAVLVDTTISLKDW